MKSTTYINEIYSRTEVELSYKNNEENPVEITIEVPMRSEIIFNRLIIKMKDKIIETKVIKNDKAEEKYNDAISSGNTGIGEATFANAKGYKFVAVIQPQVSVERSQILKALGAELLQVTDVPGFAEMLKTGLSLAGLYKVMNDFAKSNGWYYLNQCGDRANSEAHIKGTGPEIWEATGGKVDYVVQLVGTGGTLSGLTEFFRKKNPDVKIIGAQPAVQSLKNPEFPERNTIDGVLKFNGVPDDKVPELFKIFHTEYDECFDVIAEDAYETGRKLVKQEGFFVGQSAGAALWTATQVAKRPEAKGKNIIVILADNAFKYLSTNMYR